MTDNDFSRRRILRALGAGGAASIAGCTGGDQRATPTTGTGDAGQAGSTPGDEQLKDSATVAIKTDPTADTWAVYGGVMGYYTNILEPLVWVNENLEKVPWLAKSWERTGDKTFEFTIREGVKFHNGEPLTADEVVWSFETILNEWTWASGWLHITPEGVRKVDDMTVEFTTIDVYPTFPGGIAHNLAAIQHPDRERAGQPIATGPYKVEEIEKGQYVKTSVFDDYWREPAKTAIDFRVITDENTRSLALQGHDVDVAYGLPRDKVDSFRKSDKTDVITRLAAHSAFTEIHTKKAPTDDVKLRKALNYAVSQEALVESALNGIGQPARGVIPPVVYWSGHDALPKYGPNEEKARELVEQSDYDGETLQFIVEPVQPVNSKLQAQVIQGAASEVGIDIDIKMMEEAAFEEALTNDGGHLFLEEKGSNSAAADYIIYDWYSEHDGANWYDMGEKADSLIRKGFQTSDPQVKKESYVKAQQIMAEKAVVLPLYYTEYVIGTRKDVEGLDKGLIPIVEMSRFTELEHLK